MKISVCVFIKISSRHIKYSDNSQNCNPKLTGASSPNSSITLDLLAFSSLDVNPAAVH